MSKPLRMLRVIPRGTLIGPFGDPEAAFPAAEGVELHEAVRSRNGPRKAQGAATTWACGVEHGVVGEGCIAHIIATAHQLLRRPRNADGGRSPCPGSP